MRGRLLSLLAVLAGVTAMAQSGNPPPLDPSMVIGKPQTDYLIGCGGCHGETGKSNSRLVPDLRDQVGYYLMTKEGREYLARLPNVAFYFANDTDLAAILNYAIFDIGGAGVPPGAKRYTAAEVARLRKRPLNEVSLVQYRAHLVDDLIANHGAPATMRFYTNQYLPQ